MRSKSWPAARIEDVCEGVYDGPHATPAKTPSGAVFLGIWNIANGRLDLSETEHLSEADWPRWTRRVVPRENDLVFSYETKLGCAALVPAGLRCCLGRRMALARPDLTKIDPHFLLFTFLGAEFQEVIRKHTTTGSTVDRIPLLEFPKFPLRLPPLPEQRAIAGVLGALDDKIEVNRKTARVLEGIARAVFTSWFVDFDPVRHRAAAGSGSAASLPADLAALFPKRLVGSPIGQVPEGWRIAKLKQLTAKIGSGATPRGGSAVYVDSGVALIRSQNVHDHDFRWDGLARLNEQSAEELRGVEVKPNDVLLNITGDSILRTCVVDPTVLPARVNQHVAIIRAIDGVPPRYLHLFMVQPRMKDHLLGLNAGATRQAITKGHLEETDVLRPTADVLAAFDVATGSLFARVQLAVEQNRTLAALRDALLPKLISGELRIADAEKIVGRAA